MKFLIGFIFAAPLWFAFLMTMNYWYLKGIDCFGPDIRVGYWTGVSIAGLTSAFLIWDK